MNGAWPVLAVVVPLALALLLVPPAAPVMVARLAPLAPLPALFAGLGAPSEMTVDWLLMGMRFQVGAESAPLLILLGVLWSGAGLFGVRWFRDDPAARRYWLFHLLTLAANAGVCVAGDLVGFYTWYALLTLAVYALVVHDLEPASRFAARIYAILAITAEGLLIAALLLLGAQVGNAPLDEVPRALVEHPRRDLLLVLVFAGFAVKMGTMPLHVWLPMAHPRAPVPASAVLSGVIVKAGLLGWLRMLPLGEALPVAFGAIVIVLGMTTALAAAGIGLCQQRAKALLAYSTVSQMGLITVLVGVGLLEPRLWPALLPVVLVFALNHGLTKGALFLACGVRARWRVAVAALPALSLAGLPLTGGAFAKAHAKRLLESAPESWGSALPVLFVISSVATTLLIVRLLWLFARERGWDRRDDGLERLALVLLVTASLLVPWWWAVQASTLDPGYVFRPAALYDAAWPVALGVAIFALALRISGRHGLRLPSVPEGDIVHLAVAWLRPLRALRQVPMPRWHALSSAGLPAGVARAALHVDRRYLGLGLAGALLFVTALLIALLGR